MKLNTLIIVLCLLGIFQNTAEAQRSRSSKRVKIQTFEGGVLAGLSLSQLDGDYFTGFDKAGLYMGIRGIVNFTPRISFNMELLYSQKGSKIPHERRTNGGNEIRDRIVELNYAEVPLLGKFFISPEPNSPFIEIGGSFSQLLQTNITERSKETIEGTVYEEVAEEFNSFDFNAICGIGYRPLKRFEMALRFHFGMVKVYDNEEFTRPNPRFTTVRDVQFLRNYQFTILAAYKIK